MQEKLDQAAKMRIMQKVHADGFEDIKAWYVWKLASGIKQLAEAFYPRPVIVRFGDFKSNEYAQLEGGSVFEQHEENPMIGLRGASRYMYPYFQQAFELECEALKMVRNQYGLINCHLMVPFVRTVHEAQAVTQLLSCNGLCRGENGLLWYMMVEVPSNVIIFEKFEPLFDGFSIGSNDLTQLTLGVDRDSGILTTGYNERNEAILWMLQTVILILRSG
jgi:pyruvate,water dikinase